MAQTGVGAYPAGCCPNWVPCASNRPQSMADPDRGPPSMVWGRFWPFLTRLTPFLGYPSWLGPPQRGARGQLGAKTQDSGRAPLGKANPRISRRGRRQSRRSEKIASVTYLLVACLFLLWGEGCSNYPVRNNYIVPGNPTLPICRPCIRLPAPIFGVGDPKKQHILE